MPETEGRSGPAITIKTGRIINTKGPLEPSLPEGRDPQEVPVALEQEGDRSLGTNLSLVQAFSIH